MDPQHDKPGIIRRRHPKRDTHRHHLRQNSAMETKATLAEVIAWAEEHVSVPFDEVAIHFSTFTWVDAATEPEIAEWDREQRAQAARAERWQREMLATLIAQYGVPDTNE